MSDYFYECWGKIRTGVKDKIKGLRILDEEFVI
jgi:hypothetical protein